MSLDGTIKLDVLMALVSALDLANARSDLAYSKTVSLANGVGLGQINAIYHEQLSIAGSATTTLDVAGGGLVDPFGAAFAPARLKAAIVYSLPANLNSLDVIRTANGVPFLGAAADKFTVTPGGLFVGVNPSAAGWVVAAGTADEIALTNIAATNTILIDVILLGANT